ncbi:DNA-directed RNA polymerase III subunit RPC3, partial [Lecanoromycetidae sp. Uapishka_2]
MYEAHATGAYTLVRSGKYVKIAEDQLNRVAGTAIFNLLLFGHAKVGDLVEACQASFRKDSYGPTTASNLPSTNAESNGVNHMQKDSEDEPVTLKTIHTTLCELLRLGFVSRVNESHFRSDADNRLEAQKVVPPPEYYKAKSKKENEAQWEASIQKKLEEWKFGTTAEKDSFESLAKGQKRLLDGSESSRARKRQRFDLDQSSEALSLSGSDCKPKEIGEGYLDNDLVLHVNHLKFAVIMRNNSLVKLAEQSICTSTSKVYARVLVELETGTRACRDEFHDADTLDYDPETSSLPQASTGTLLATIQDSAELTSAISKVDSSKLGPIKADQLIQRRQKTEIHSEDEIMINGHDSSDEEDDDSDSRDSDTSISPDPDKVNGDATCSLDTLQKHPQDSHRETVRNHLLLLAKHPLGFLEQLHESANEPERWTVLYRPLVKAITHHAVLETITARFGLPAARLTRLLSEKGKIDEKNLQSLSLMNQKTMRSYLSILHEAGMIQLQEVPRDNSRNPQRTMFLWYFDIERCKMRLLQETYKTMARCLQRARVERDKVKGTIEKATRSDVEGKEEEFLAPQELQALRRWREIEEKIWGEIGRLDDFVAIIRDY